MVKDKWGATDNLFPLISGILLACSPQNWGSRIATNDNKNNYVGYIYIYIYIYIGLFNSVNTRYHVCMFFLFAFLEFEVNCFIYRVEKIIKCLFVVMSVWELFVLFCFLGGFKNVYCNIFYLKCHETQPNSANAYLIDKTADVAQMITVCLSLATQHALQQSVKKNIRQLLKVEK